MNELKRNGSGYYDVTAYKALTNILKQEREKNMIEARKGDIITYDTKNGKEIIAVVVSSDEYNNDIFVITCILGENTMNELCIPYNFRDKCCINCSSFAFVYKKNIKEILKVVEDKVMKDIDRNISKAFGLRDTATLPDNEMNVRLIAEKCELQDKNERLRKEIEKLNYELKTKNNSPESSELVRVEVERDVYKELYTQLINKAVV